MRQILSKLFVPNWRDHHPHSAASVDVEDGEVMARRAFAVSRLTPSMMVANIFNAGSILLVLYLKDQNRIDAFIWAAIVVVIAGYFLFRLNVRRAKPFPQTLPQRMYRRSIYQSSVLGALWAYPGLVMLPELDGISQAFLVAMAAGMVAGGAITLYPMPLAAYSFCGLILLGSLLGFSRTGEPAFWGFVFVSATFAMITFKSILRHERIFVSEFALRKLLDRQNDRMGEMLEEAREEVRTERKLAENRLLQTQKMEAIGQLTAGIAHDFNNLLTAVRGNAELLRLSQDTQNELIDPIIHSADSGAALVRQLLAFARKQNLVPVPVSARVAIEESVDLLRRGLREDIRIKIDLDDALWAIRIDPDLLRNALLNLGTNARDAMPQAGTITITAQNLAYDGEAGRKGECVRLSFCDTGTGMPEYVRERAIEPFYTTKEFGAGSGLGLSMVYGFVKQSGGDMTIKSEPHGGTCVYLDLPRSLEAIEGSDAEETQSPPEKQAQSVLLIEDNPTVRTTLTAIIKSLEYTVTSVESVEQARRFLKTAERHPDILVADIVLPGGQWGTEFAREVAARHPEISILLISGFHSELTSFGLEANQGRLLQKPFSRDELADALNAIVN